MAKTITNYLLRNEFETWLQSPVGGGISNTNVGQYSRLDKYNGTNLLYYDIIASFLYIDDPTYAYTVLEEWGDIVKNRIQHGASTSLKTYWNKYKQFIMSIDVKSKLGLAPTLVPSRVLDSIRKNYTKTSGDLYQYDGMESLIKTIGYNEIIKLAIESSFFFAKDIADDYYSEICKAIKTKDKLPARSSDKTISSRFANQGKHIISGGQLCYQDENNPPVFDHPIELDGNGNASVCSIINGYTGYNLAYKSELKPFLNYIISHIWSRAIDPRYFSNIWNIVLVPAWVNHLLDKENGQGSLSSMLKSTFMKVCLKHYDLKSYNWSPLNMTYNDLTNKVINVDVVHDVYSINVIKRSSNPFKIVGKIVSIKCKV